ncbi:MAG: prolipoprotein diacylglyceryl transferase [Candidatus Doudnabacteria bacterium]|nr:prolipoprotein diacylglyceryl transferase [Candidatus Doudnabacteria bacterium]
MKIFYWASAIVLAMALVFFVFAPAFAGKIAIPSQINIGKFGLRFYGLILASGILIGYFIARKFSWRFGISKSEVDDIAFWITIIGLIGARIYYVVFEWDLFSHNISEVYKIWHGGLSIYGALISGLIFILIYGRHKAYSMYQLLDLAALSLPLAQAVGRFGNFFNQEAYGLPTNLPWKMYVDISNRPLQFKDSNFFHPAFLYEAILNCIIFFILTKLLVGKVKSGVLAFTYLGLYSLGRFFIEGIRLDSSYLGGIKVDQLTAIIGVMAAGIFIFLRQGKVRGAWEAPK